MCVGLLLFVCFCCGFLSLFTCLFGLHVPHVSLQVYAYVHVHGMKHTNAHIYLYTCILGCKAWGITPGAIKRAAVNQHPKRDPRTEPTIRMKARIYT